MHRKQQQHKDRKLLQQLYSRLNITWQQRPQSATKNPILHQTQNNLVSKSIAHKFYNSKKYKLNQWKPVQKKQSSHVFTNSGIINRHSRKLSDPVNLYSQLKQNSVFKYQRYQNCSIIISTSQLKNPNRAKSRIDDGKLEDNSAQKNSSRSIRAMSANLSSRKHKNYLNEFSNFRRSSLNFGRKNNKNQEKFQIKGWDIIDFDQFDTNCINLRVSTELN